MGARSARVPCPATNNQPCLPSYPPPTGTELRPSRSGSKGLRHSPKPWIHVRFWGATDPDELVALAKPDANDPERMSALLIDGAGTPTHRFTSPEVARSRDRCPQ